MASRTSRWVIGGVVLVGILLLVSEHDSRTGGEGGSPLSDLGGSGPCTVTVTADSLNVRSTPDGDAPVVEKFGKGALLSADRTIRNGFRSLGPDRWAAEEFLDPTPGSDCG